MKKILVIAAVALMTANVFAQNIKLPAPDKSGGMPLMKAIAERRSAREFDSKPLSDQTLSNLLWAAYGFNRPYMRTVASDHNKQEFDLYVALEKGTYRYLALEHELEPVAAGDLRPLTGKQEFVKTAPLNLVYVYDMDKQTDTNGAYTDCGLIAQNVYLVCASEGLASVLRVYIDFEALGKALKLSDRKKILYSQTVGYPKK